MHYLNVSLEDDVWDALHRAKIRTNSKSWSEFFMKLLEGSDLR